ncbi:MAG: L,D-transpeptidase family protein [Desulfobaccales bacterium]
MSILRKLLGFFLVLGLLGIANLAWGAGPFTYRLPRGGMTVDPEAVTVVGEPQIHHIVRYENLYYLARKYDLGFWELAHYHWNLDHFYLPWDTDIVIPTQWIIPERSHYPGYLINVAELRGYRFLGQNQVRTYPIGIGVLDYESPIGKHMVVTNKSVNPGWHIPPHLQAKYGMSYMPPGEDCPVGDRWMGMAPAHYGLHGTCYPQGVGRLVSHGCNRHYPEDIHELFDITPIGTTVEYIYEPVKIGYLHGRIFIEVHEDIYSKIPDMLQYATKKIEERGLAGRIDWQKVLQAVAEESGAPLEITRGSTASAATAQIRPGAE